MARNRDKKIELSQQLLGAGITAVNRAMTVLMTSDEKIQAIKMLSDSCRILSHLHHTDTQARIKMVTPGLEKSFLNVIKDNERDSTLFGLKLSEKIKASKAIERQSLQIKKTPMPQKPPHTVQLAVSRNRYQENWSGPSRYQSNRGGARRPEETSPCSTQGTASGANEVFEHEQNACSTSTIDQSSPSALQVAYPGCRGALRLAFTQRGTPSTALELMLASLSNNTHHHHPSANNILRMFERLLSNQPPSGWRLWTGPRGVPQTWRRDACCAR
ncbi:hypothetical protein PYW08_013016 [Mythimna loreyi]|uniref:Uncharacterized protein n=1 Tax=Mythimna loreyi TaxID=667449 RepID=A0ACC2Q0N4_9NEOP|nr:hypothetical protein PYW08_013016 [Mythimna loreyi]